MTYQPYRPQSRKSFSTTENPEGGGAILRILQQTLGNEYSEARGALETVLANIPDPVLLFDQSANLLAKNEYGSKLWAGYENFVPALLLSQVVRTAKSGRPFRTDDRTEMISIQSKEGNRYFLPRVFPLLASEHPEDGSVETYGCESDKQSLIVCILKDETEMVRAEQVRNNLLSTISHELNTPLTSARLALYLLAEKKIGDLNQAQTDMVERAKQDLDREITTIRNVLDLIRSRSVDTKPSEAKSLNLHESIEAVIDQFQRQTGTFGDLLERNYSARSPWVKMETDIASMAIHLLFASVLKYSKEISKITVATEVSDSQICRISVSTKSNSLQDFTPANLFQISLESAEARMLNCADLGLRVAHEIIVPMGGGFTTRRDSERAEVSFHYPALREGE